MNDESSRRHLLHRIRKTYATKVERYALGPLELEFLRIADPDAVLDAVAEEVDRREKVTGHRDAKGDTLGIPYWAALWDSSYAIGADLAARTDLRGVDVLDLGCGMGLTACCAAHAGARVVAADLEPPSLLFAAYNAHPWRDRVTTRRTNWQKDNLGQRFPLIVGADILYEKAQWPYLDAFFRAHLADEGEILLGEPGRQTGEHFVSWAEAKGWSVTVDSRRVKTREAPIRILTLRVLP